MSDFKNSSIQLAEVIARNEIKKMFKTRIGSFVKYSAEDTTTRKADIQFYNIEKNDDLEPAIPLVLEDVPLVYFGNNRAQQDFDLLPGDEMLVLFSDRPTDNWRQIGGNIPSISERDDLHSIDYAVAIPIVTFHNALTKSTIGTYQIKLQTGQKLQIGVSSSPAAFDIELIQELYTVFNAMNSLVYADGDSFATAFNSFKTAFLAPLLTKLQTLGTVV